MHTKFAIALVAAAATAGATAISILGSEGAIIEMNPAFDAKLIRKAHRKLLKDTLLGRTPSEMLDRSDEEINDFFLAEYVAPLMNK